MGWILIMVFLACVCRGLSWKVFLSGVGMVVMLSGLKRACRSRAFKKFHWEVAPLARGAAPSLLSSRAWWTLAGVTTLAQGLVPVGILAGWWS